MHFGRTPNSSPRTQNTLAPEPKRLVVAGRLFTGTIRSASLGEWVGHRRANETFSLVDDDLEEARWAR